MLFQDFQATKKKTFPEIKEVQSAIGYIQEEKIETFLSRKKLKKSIKVDKILGRQVIHQERMAF